MDIAWAVLLAALALAVGVAAGLVVGLARGGTRAARLTGERDLLAQRLTDLKQSSEEDRRTAAELAQATVWSLTDDQLGTYLDQVHAAEQALAAARLHLINEITGRALPARQGARSTTGWLGGRLHISARTATHWIHLGRVS